MKKCEAIRVHPSLLKGKRENGKDKKRTKIVKEHDKAEGTKKGRRRYEYRRTIYIYSKGTV